jgi:hypothetical protein
MGRERGFTLRLFPARLSFPIERGTHSEDDVRSFSERQSDERREKRRCDVFNRRTRRWPGGGECWFNTQRRLCFSPRRPITERYAVFHRGPVI